MLRQLDYKPTSPAKLWRWDFVPNPDWLGTPIAARAVQDASYPPSSPTKLWRWDYVPASEWLATPLSAGVLAQLDYKPTAPQKLWRYDYDSDIKLWLGQPIGLNPNNYVFTPAPIQAPFYGPRGDTETKLWVGAPIPMSFQTFNIKANVNPFFKLWRSDVVPPPDWLGTPQSAFILEELDYKPSAAQKFWRWDLVPSTDWLGTSQAARILQQLDYKPASPQKFWRYDYVPPTEWVGNPKISRLLEILISGGNPFHRLWRYDYDSDIRLWLGKPDPVPFPIFSGHVVVQKAVKTKFWRYDWDSDFRAWQARPLASNIEFLKPAPTPPIPPVLRRYSIKNLFPPNLTYTVANPNTTLPTPARTSPLVKVYVNEPATVYMNIYDVAPVEYQVTASSVVLQFIRPDGTFYYVVGSPYTYISNVYGYPFITYTSAVGEFNQVGWWTVVFTIGTAQSQQFAFYIHAPGQ